MENIYIILVFFLSLLCTFLIVLSLILYNRSKKLDFKENENFIHLPIHKSFIENINSKNQGDFYKSLLNTCKELFNFTSASIYTFSATKDFITLKQSIPSKNSIEKKLKTIPFSNESNFLIRSLLDNSPYVIPDIQHDRRVLTEDLIPNTQALITYPLNIFEDESLGILLMNFDKSYPFSEKQLTALDFLLTLTLNRISDNHSAGGVKDFYKKQFKKEQEKLKKEIESMQQQLVLSGKLSSLGALASGIAHEIRNPLTIIKMLIDDLSKDPNNPFLEDTNVMKSEIDRMAEIINQFLDFARPKKLTKIKNNINMLLRETLRFLQIELSNKNVEVDLNLYSTLPSIYCDQNQLKQVFINLILNAAKAIELENIKEGIVTIKTGVRLYDSKKTVKITIEDNGPGIPNEIIDKIFEPFITTKEQGIGLGLSLSYQIIENHNGIIEAQNNIHGGAKFTIDLPLEN